MRLGSEYVAVFLSDDLGGLDRVRASIPGVGDVGCTLYTAANSFLAVVIGGHHAEVVSSILEEWHSWVRGGSILGGLATARVRPPLGAAIAASLATRGMPSHFWEALDSAEKIFTVFDPASEILFMLGESPLDLPIDQGLKPTPDLRRYLFLEHKEPATRTRVSSQSYDPLAAQVTEAARQSIPAAVKEIQHVRQLWQQILPFPVSPGLAQAEEHLEYLRCSLLERLTEDSDPGLVGNVVNLATSAVQRTLEMSMNLSSQVQEYRFKPDPLVHLSKYSEGSGRLLLMAAHGLADELASRLGITEAPLLPVYAESFWVQEGIIPVTREPVFLAIPRACRFRLGALPIMAHSIAHLSLRAGRELLPAAIEGKYGNFIRGLLGKHIQDLDLNDLSSLSQHWVMAVNRWNEIMADLVASAICGPAYVFALARFAGGGLRERPEDQELRSHPPLGDRLRCCLCFLNTMGFSVRFSSRFIANIPPERLEPLLSDIGDIVPKPYTPEDHESACGITKAQLEAGNTVEDPPTHVLNALWDAVVIRGNYVNELAATLSLAGRGVA